MPKPLVSVVIPAYNAEQWIVETLRSVFAQGLAQQCFEIVVVDNGSSDATARLVARELSACGGFGRLIDEPLRGPASARNAGLAHGSGDWVQFLDADDLIHPDKLQRQIDFAVRAADDVAVVYSAWAPLHQAADGRWLAGPAQCPRLTTETKASLLGSLIETDGFIPTGSQLFRRAWLQRVCGYRDVGLIEDVDLYLRLAAAGAAFAHCRSAEPLFFYRRHAAGSLSTASGLAFARGVMRNAIFVEQWARESGALKPPLLESLVGSYSYCARALAGEDWSDFEEVVRRLEALTGRVRPSRPRSLALLSRLIGYRTAERTAVAWRALKGVSGL